MSRKEQMDWLIDVAASLEGRSPAGRRDPLAPPTAGMGGLGRDLELIKGCMAQDGTVSELPERLVLKAIACYPRGENAVEVVLSYVRGALEIISASQGIVLSGPVGAVALRNEGPRELPFVSLSKTFNRAVLDVIVEGSGVSGCTFTVQATDVRTRSPLAQSRVELISGARELASASLVEGRAQFEEVRTGRYELVVRKNGAVLGMMTINIVP